MKYHYLVLSSFVLLAACGKDDKSAPKTPVVPETLAFSKPTPGAQLTPAQVNEIKSTFQAKQMMILPPTDLIFVPKNMNAQTKSSRELQLKQEDANAHSLLTEIRQGCAKQRPTGSMDATAPIDGDGSLENLQTGDKLSFSATGGLNGAGCPVDAGGSFNMGATVDSKAQGATAGTATGSSGAKFRGVVNNPKYAKLLGTRGITSDTRVSAIGTTKDISSGSGILDVTGSGSYLTLQSEVPFTYTVKLLTKVTGEKQSTTETIYTADLAFPTFRASLVVHGSNVNDKESSKEVYLNGHLMSDAQMDAMFGENQAQVTHPALLINSLK